MHALSTLLVALGLPVLALAIEGPEKLIYFDESCTKRERWNEYYGESNAMVESAARRLRSRTDTDYHTVVQRLFKITPADTENWNKLIKVMDALSGWETTDDLESLEKSTVRMYCDNDEHRFYNGGDDDARWQEDVQTIEVDGKDRVILDTDGSQMMQWIDFTNGIEIVPPVVDVEEEKKKVNEEDRQVPWKPHERKPACLSGNELGIHGATYRNSIKEHYEEQNSGRRTITICDYTFHPPEKHLIGPMPAHLSDIQDFSVLEQKNVDAEYFAFLISLTITHERDHASFDHINDEEEDNVPSYNWPNIVKKDTATALNNADNYAYLALYALLADKGWIMKRDSDYRPGTPQQTIEYNRNHGILTAYRDVTIRSVKGRLARMLRA